MLTEWLKVLLLGIIEGVTEFLPVSSTGHLLIASELLNFAPHLRFTFEIFIQLGAIVAVVIFYFQDIFRQVRTVRSDRNVQHFWLCIIIAFIPAGVIGLLIHPYREAISAPPVITAALIVGGIILILIERLNIADRITSETLESITHRQALLIGIAQVVALIPGTSRSAASIIGGLLVGLDRKTATAFSFYLAIPTLGGATIFQLITSLDEISANDLAFLLVGAVISGLIAWLSIRWLLRYISRNNFVIFGYYRIAVGVVLLILMAAGALSGAA